MKAAISVKGTDDLQHKLNELQKRVAAEAQQRLGAIAMEVLREAKGNLRRNRTNTYHNLERSGRITEIENGYQVGFYSRYAAAVEYGRRAGKRPPMQPIDDWLKKKGLIAGRSDKAARQRRSAAFLIARKIGRVGTKPQPYFFPAVAKFQPKMASAVADSVKKVINEVTQ
jgi:hypothetical protein